MVAAALQYVLHGVLTRWTPQRFVEAAWRTQATHPAVRHVDPFRAKPRDQSGTPRQPGTTRDLAVARHLSRGNGPYRSENALRGVARSRLRGTGHADSTPHSARHPPPRRNRGACLY